ncbi:hypothetical protein E2P81_ATG06837 [Venturia nashicola]|uniref:Uncharacterized protein n=1 Tax=Venturia nashicola TaxID=86259 RepID=A0A4Z1NUC2_9PEZI|nr:hypothetical protein E6O75_ATG07008 [Venturia nashicola]TLD30184.1 hypothetical protein E2P81_ATG06837 [Venturia nashicola]
MDMPPPVYKLKDDPEALIPVPSEAKAVENRRLNNLGTPLASLLHLRLSPSSANGLEIELANERESRKGCIALAFLVILITWFAYGMIELSKHANNHTASNNATASNNGTASNNHTAPNYPTASNHSGPSSAN